MPSSFDAPAIAADPVAVHTVAANPQVEPDAIAAKVAEDLAREEAEAAARREAEEKARKEAEAEAKREEEERARKEAEAKEKAKREAEERLRQEAEEKARREAEERAREEADERARKEAEEKARREAEEKAKREAAAKARREAEEKARREAEERARKEAEKEARRAAEKKAREEAEAKAKREAEEKARREAEEQARKEAEERARKEAEAKEKAKREAEEKARLEAEEKTKKEAKEKARREAKLKAKREAEEKARREAEKAKKDAEAKRKAEEKAEEKKRKEVEKKARAEAEAAAKAAAEEEERQAAEAREEADARAELAKIDLSETFPRLIRETGPISLARYMAESNARYYAGRNPLGEEGDFITAPEVSQMFGELIGLWLADLWVRMGARKHIHYVELGPGRGTLSKDALRTAGRYDFDPQIHFVEGSPALRAIQSEAFPGATHHHDVSTLPDDAPLLIVANEFFDALPIHQLVRSATGWHERMIGLEDGKLAFVAGDTPMDSIVPKSWATAPQGTMIETSPAAVSVMAEIATRLKDQGGAALIIDYGARELRAGSTLQALRKHEKVDVLACPGEADLTAHVDFELLQDVAERNGADVMGLQMQGDWLIQMGIDVRTEALQRKNPAEKDKVQRQYDRLVQDNQMGALFKVLGVCGRRWPIGVGFD